MPDSRRFLLLILFLVAAAFARADDLNRELNDHYSNRNFLLRGFYQGEHLRYDARGQLAEGASTGDWTEAIVRVERIKVSHQKLRIEANRMLATAAGQKGLGLIESSRDVTIDVKLGAAAKGPGEIDSILGQIFLNQQDRLLDVVPDYWRPCLKVALAGVDDATYRCHFSSELVSLPGVGSYSKDDPALTSTASNADLSLVSRGPDGKMHPVRNGVTPPKMISHTEPEFNDAARRAHVKGTVILAIVIDRTGIPRDIRVAAPLGCGLDAQAVRAVQTWKFQPAMRDGQPISVEVAMEADFRMY